MFSDADGTSLGLSQQGSVGPNWSPFGSTNDANTDVTTYNAEIQENWRAWVASTRYQWQAANSWDLSWATALENLWSEIQKAEPYIEALITVLAA